jgi:release factor glutamine methyltransferase
VSPDPRIKAAVMEAESLATALDKLAPLLAEAGIEDPDSELRAMRRALASDLSGERGARNAPAHPEPFLIDQRRRLVELARGRAKRIPLDRLLGERGFWTLDLILNAGTLSPRPDTETLVLAALDHLARMGRRDDPLRFLDLGTGTGAILLALLAECPKATGLGIDREPLAIRAARANALRNEAAHKGLAARAAFEEGDWFAGLSGRFDLILSNPPYIRGGALAGLEPEVRDHDPVLALDGGADGLDAYRSIIASAGPFLSEAGLLLLEIGFDQAEEVSALAAAQDYALVEKRRDFGGLDRILVFKPLRERDTRR